MTDPVVKKPRKASAKPKAKRKPRKKENNISDALNAINMGIMAAKTLHSVLKPLLKRFQKKP